MKLHETHKKCCCNYDVKHAAVVERTNLITQFICVYCDSEYPASCASNVIN